MLFKTDIWDSVFNNYKDPICIVDRNFNILRINNNLLKLIGSSELVTIGSSSYDCLFRSLSQKQVKQIENVLLTKKREAIYFVFNDKYFELTIDPVFTDTNQIFALVLIYNDVSDRIKYEEILKQKDDSALLQNFLKNFNGIIYRCKNDSNRTFESVSDGCYNLTGFKMKDIIDKEIALNELIIPEQREKVIKEWQRVLNSRLPFNVEYQIKTANGEIKWVWEQGYGIYSDESKVISIEGCIVDITPRKLSEETLIENEKRYRSLFNNAAIPIWEEDFSNVKLYLNSLKDKGISNIRTYFDQNPEEIKKCVNLIKVIDVNEESIRFFKLLKKEQVDFNLQHYFLEESYDVLKEEIISLAEGNTLFECEIPVTNFAGVKNHLLLRLVVVPGKEKDLSQVLVSFIDITERNRAIQQLIESEERLHILINNLPDFICFKDGEGRLLKANEAGLKLFELEDVDYKGKKCTDLSVYTTLFKETFSNFDKSDEIAWNKGNAIHVEENIPRHDGCSLVYQITKIPTYDKSGKRKGLVIVGRDITQLKKAK